MQFVGCNFWYILEKQYLLIFKIIFLNMHLKPCKLVVYASQDSKDSKNLEENPNIILTTIIKYSMTFKKQFPVTSLGVSLCSVSLNHDRQVGKNQLPQTTDQKAHLCSCVLFISNNQISDCSPRVENSILIYCTQCIFYIIYLGLETRFYGYKHQDSIPKPYILTYSHP